MKPSLLRKLLFTISSILISAFVIGQLIGLLIMRGWFLNEELEKFVPRMMNIAEEIKITDGTIFLEGEEGFIIKAYDTENQPIIINRNIEESEKHFTEEEIQGDLSPYMDKILQGEKVACIAYLRNMRGKSIVIGLPVIREDKIIGSIFAIKLASDYNIIINGFYIIFFTTTLIALILILILVRYFTKKQIKPLVEMIKLSNMMAAGHYNIKANEEGYGEIKELSDSLNCLGEKLLEADRKAKRYEQTRRDYIANISHELRTPISSIRAIAETLGDGIEGNEQKKRKYYAIMLRESKRLQKLINEMLELSRLQSDSQIITREWVNGREMMNEVADYFEIFAEDTDVSFNVTETALNIPDFYSNKERIIQILVILLDNAFKFTTEKGRVEVDAEWNEEKIRISVSNTGKGITAEDLEFIFDRFYKGDKSHNEKGSGLGLSLVKEIIRHLDEKIEVSSDLNKVTKFTFTLSRDEKILDMKKLMGLK